MSIFIFDTETTGLDVNNSRILSICWNIYRPDGVLLKSKYYIIKPDGFPVGATHIHGITDDIASNGTPLIEVINDLNNDLNGVVLLVGHSIGFDRTMLLAELMRLGRNDILNKLMSINQYCTMVKGTELCKLPRPNGQGYKWPKLQELHKHFFGYEFVGNHNARDDTDATAKCYFKLKENNI